MESPRSSLPLQQQQQQQRRGGRSIVIRIVTIFIIALGTFRNFQSVETVFRNEDRPVDSFVPSIDDEHRAPALTATSSSSAYAFVIGGCDPANRASYQNYLFNIAIAARILKRLGSQADVVALFQMSQTASSHQLPFEDLQLLRAQNVQVYIIPQQVSGRESFYRTQLDKFRILGLTQYDKILFMDGDIMPLCNLDFFFTHEHFHENVLMQGLYEPVNGGFFMLKTGFLQDVQQIIKKRESEASSLPEPLFFDPITGWGQELKDDPWVSAQQSGTNWTFLAAFADQGLLYYYAKYHRKSFSRIQRHGGVEHYGWNGTAVSQIGSLDYSLTHNHSSVIEPLAMLLSGKHRRHPFPQRCILHFTGVNKPWLRGGAPPDCCVPETQYRSGKHYWSFQLHELLLEMNRTIDLKTYWDPEKGNHIPALGLFPREYQVLNAQTNILTPLELMEWNTVVEIDEKGGIIS